ncbi:MAG: C10 family peptidase [Porphyromonadaceae bacterium]|nr:C10 family peptidase [Porphyromonadaceae bacterium]
MQLKYLFTAICVLSLSWSSQADPVDRAQATKLASRYVRLHPSYETQLRASLEADCEPAYYIFNDRDREGFVIISGDDRTAPVLGYGSSGELDPKKLPEPLARLLAMHTERLEKMRGAMLIPGVPIPIPKPNPKAIKGPLLRSLWNQSAPFNDQAPLIGSQRAVTGCVATAMAQLMYYHKWPIRGLGSHSYRHSTGTLSVNFAESVYDWEHMLDEYAYDDPLGDPKRRKPLWNDVQARAVAKLMLDAGIAISTGYNLSDSGSGSNVGEAERALAKYFGYRTKTVYRNYTPSHKVLAAIKQELDRDNPILMVGSQKTSGHAWVLDGYDENGYLHVNWGWGGLSNGYFALSFMSPDNAGIGGFVGGYNQGQVLLLAHPNREGSEGFASEPDDCLYLLPKAGLRFHQSLTDLSRREIGIRIERLAKQKNPTYKAEIAIALRNSQGEQLQLTPHSTSLEGQEHNGVYRDIVMTVSLPEELADGAYSLHTMYRAAGHDSAPWLEVSNDIPLYFSVKAGAIVLPPLAEQTDLVLRLTEQPRQLTPFWQGQSASVLLSVDNPTPFDSEFGDIMLRLKKDGKSYEVSVEQFRFHDHSRYAGIVSVPSTHPRPLEVGLYDVEFFFRRPGLDQTIVNDFGPFQLEVLESAGKPLVVLAQDYASRNGMSRSLMLRRGTEEWNDERLDLKSLEGNGLTAHAILFNKGAVPYHGPITFALVDAVTGDRHILETKLEQTIEPNALRDDLLVQIPYALLESLPKERRYDLRIFASIDGQEREVWAEKVYRRALIITGINAAPIAEVSYLEEIPSVTLTDRHIVLSGFCVGEQIWIINLSGQVVYQATMPEMREVQLPISGFSAGIYIVCIQGYRCKLIV